MNDQIEVVMYEIDQFENIRELPVNMVSPEHGDTVAIKDETGMQVCTITFTPRRVTIRMRTTK
jgi:hypothetical protein